MRGFGNLIIVDHGGEYLSIYGNNQALLKRAGDSSRPATSSPARATPAATKNRGYTLSSGIWANGIRSGRLGQILGLRKKWATNSRTSA
jgi:hypothetical protein